MADTYVKYIDQYNIQFPPKDDLERGIINYNKDIDLLIQDGYKLFVEAVRPETNRMYHIEYINNTNNVTEAIVYDETQQEADARDLEVAKQNKIAENDSLRDVALNQGVVYEDILFDSDTDQKVNLLATVSMMDDEDTIIWFGMDNQPLECTKADLFAIGSLITQLDSFCWTRNAEIKTEINEATTKEEVEAIEINYEMNEEV